MSHLPTPSEQKEALRGLSFELGFDAFGVAGVESPPHAEFYSDWIADGQHAGMGWMERNQIRRLNPSMMLEGARSVICLGTNYWQPSPERPFRVARYALGADYHKVLLKRMKQICRFMRETYGSDQKPCVDTAPVLEKPLGSVAGLGWQGKSTILLNRSFGTWMFLSEIFTTLELPRDAPANNHCGKCTRCIVACPTAAINAPYSLDARRCLSYWSIEHKEAIPEWIRIAMHDRVFGCDDCLDVCPWNRFARRTREAKFAARDIPPVHTMLEWTEVEFNAAFVGTAIRRLGLTRWKRNLSIVLGNTGTKNDIVALKPLAESTDPLIAEHASWAIRRILQRDSGEPSDSLNPS